VLDQPVGALEAAGEEVLEVGTGLLDLGAGVGSIERNASSSSSLTQSTGSEKPVPRGSKPTMS
jgi:hypothetical protein